MDNLPPLDHCLAAAVFFIIAFALGVANIRRIR